MNFIKKHKTLSIICLIVLLLIICVILVLVFKPKDPKITGSYREGEVIELPGSKTYNNENLIAKHCLNGICISDATFYYNDEFGRIDYTITNTSKETKSGYLKMVFGDESLIIAYSDLKPNKSVKSSSQYWKVEINDMTDYKLEKLSDKEISQIIK